ncbi:carboxymuconolactone decarboxylase family protein [Mesorhizobium sp. M0152]|uniref:carboxymuconolactone decarboxylase family protein n=1 Tax=Mesorhizobium sp. M0152 TaxID=2956898 RepID=UPI0033356BE0
MATSGSVRTCRHATRSVVTVAALVAKNQVVEMAFHVNVALDNGVKPAELSEIITQGGLRRS